MRFTNGKISKKGQAVKKEVGTSEQRKYTDELAKKRRALLMKTLDRTFPGLKKGNNSDDRAMIQP